MVADPAQVRDRLLSAGARPGFRGLMTDLRFDRQGELAARDEALRIRRLRQAEGREQTLIGWKGPTAVTALGHKQRRELEYCIHSDRLTPEALLEALGYEPIFLIERYVEYYHLGGADLRLEWYPRMDTLIEVEGDPAAIEAGIGASGLPRSAFSADPLTVFVGRYAARTGLAAALTTAQLGSETPSWSGR